MIELLITISIVLVLTALALPSLQNAAVRARVARVRADLRTVATAVEMYTTDHNQPPRMRHWDFYSDPELDIFGGELMAANLSPVMTTPIAYLQSCDLADPFTNAEADIPFTERLYTYQVINVYTERNPASAFWRRAQAEFGTWRLGSIGPDKAFDHGFRNSAQLPYDATNGAISLGNLWRTQTARFDAQGLPPIPELLGVPSGR